MPKGQDGIHMGIDIVTYEPCDILLMLYVVQKVDKCFYIDIIGYFQARENGIGTLKYPSFRNTPVFWKIKIGFTISA